MARRQTSGTADSGDLLESQLLKFGSKLVLGTIIVMVFLTIVQCTVKSPEAPVWSTQLTIPVINRTYSMSELVVRIDQEGISLDSSNTVIFSISEPIDTFRLDAGSLSTPDLSYSASDVLGPIDIAAPTVAPVSIDLSTIGPIAALVPGVVPAISFQIVNNIPVLGTFASATFSTGQFYIVVTNNLGLDLDTVNIQIRDKISGNILGSPTFVGGLPAGAVDSSIITLTGQTVSNDLEAIINAHTTGGTVISASGKNLTTAIRFSGPLTVISATAEIPTTSRSFSAPVSLAQTDAIYRATFTGGQLQLAIGNSSAVAANLTMSFPDLVQGVTPLLIQRSVAGGANDTVLVDLTSYQLQPSDSTVPQSLNIDVQVDIPGTAPAMVTVNQTDRFSVDAQLTGLAFGTVTGIFSANVVTVPPTVENITVPDGFDSLQLVSAILAIDVENDINLGGVVNLALVANTGNSLNINGTITAGLLSTAATSTIYDSAVAQFLSPMPSSVTVSGTMTLGDGVSEATINSNDYVFATVRIVAPLEVIVGRSQIQTDIERQSIDTADMGIVTDHLNEARFIYNITNHLPLGAQVNLYFGPDSATLYSSPQLLINNLFFTAAPTIAGVASDTMSTGFQTIQLTNADAQILKNDTLFIGTELVLDDSGGQPVKFTGNDYLTIVGRVEIDYLFDGNF